MTKDQQQERIRLADSLVGARVKFAHQVKEPQSHLVTCATKDGMVELEGWTGEFGPEGFVVVAKPMLGMADEEAVQAIGNRYIGRMDTLDLTDAGTREQLALDLGLLLGMAMRLLAVQRAARGGR